MADEGTQSNGDGILADQGSQEFTQLTGGPGEGAGGQQQTQQTQQGDQTQQGQQTQQTQQGAGDGQQTQQQQGGAGQQQGQAQTQPDLQAIIKSTVDATAAAMSRAQPQYGQQQQQAREVTPQEFDRRYGIVRPNEAMMTAIIGQDPKVAAATLDQLFQANLTAALRMSNDIVESKLRELDGKDQPHIASWQTHQQDLANKAAEDRFFKACPDLTQERELVMEMKDAFITKVQSGQVRFTDENQAFNAVATATRAILQKVGTNRGGQTQTGQGTQQQQQSQQQTSGRRMASASSAGRTGTGQATASKSVVDEVFGADAR